MYELILSEMLLTTIMAGFLALATGYLVGAKHIWFRGLCFNYAPAFAAAFYVVALFGKPSQDSLDIIAGLLFEVIILALFYRTLLNLKKNIGCICVQDAVKIIKYTLAFQLIIIYHNISLPGFGIFSEGSRIDYLFANSLAKYYTYASVLIATIQAVFLAVLVSGRGYFGVLGTSVIALNILISVLAGSKGAVFLWMLSIASLIDYKRARIQTYKLIIVLLLLVGTLWISSVVVADFLNLELSDFYNTAVSRFFLNNDARALSFDLRTSQSADFSFFSEAFRSLGNLLGLPPKNDPLGVVLYAEGLSINNGGGANASFMALATYYFPEGYTLIPALLGILGAIGIIGMSKISSKLLLKPTPRAIALSIWLISLLTYSQDFLAFQLLVPLSLVATFFLIVTRKKFGGLYLK